MRHALVDLQRMIAGHIVLCHDPYPERCQVSALHQTDGRLKIGDRLRLAVQQKRRRTPRREAQNSALRTFFGDDLVGLADKHLPFAVKRLDFCRILPQHLVKRTGHGQAVRRHLGVAVQRHGQRVQRLRAAVPSCRNDPQHSATSLPPSGSSGRLTQGLSATSRSMTMPKR